MVIGLAILFTMYGKQLQTIDPAVSEMKTTIIRLTDQLRLLDQDMIRLKEKVDTVVRLKENEKVIYKNPQK